MTADNRFSDIPLECFGDDRMEREDCSRLPSDSLGKYTQSSHKVLLRKSTFPLEKKHKAL